MKGVLLLALSPRKLAQNWYNLFLFSKAAYTNPIIAQVPLNLTASLLFHSPQASSGAHTYMLGKHVYTKINLKKVKKYSNAYFKNELISKESYKTDKTTYQIQCDL